MKKRLLSLLLCLVMILSLMPGAIFAAGNDIASGTGWRIDADGCLHFTGEVRNPSSPSTYGGDKTPWKASKSRIRSVTAESGASVDSCIHLLSDCPELVSADLRGLNTANVTTMDQMFRNCPKLTTVNLSGLNTSRVVQMFGMFTDCKSLTSVDLSGIDTSKVAEMNYMFDNCSSLTSIDLSGFNTGSLVYMSGVFRNCSAMETINISGLNVANVTRTSNLFGGCTSLKTLITSPNVIGKTAKEMMELSPRGWTMQFGSLITLRYTDAEMLKAIASDTVTLSPVSTDAGWYIDADGCLHLTGYIYNPSGADSSKEDNDQKLVPWYGQREKIRSVVAEPGSSINSCRYLFAECENLISVDLRNLDTSGVENMSCVFAGCSKLETVDLSGLDVSAVTRCYHNFDGCYALKTVITKPSVLEKTADQMFSCFNGINATGYPNFDGWMARSTGYIYKSADELKKYFGYAISLTPIVACEKDSKGNYTWYLDGTGCLHLAGTVTNPSDGSDSTPWKDYKDKIRTVAVEKGASIDNCNRMFYKCPNLVSADLRGLDTSRVTVMYEIFFGCPKLTTVNLAGLDTSKVKNMNCLFEGCTSLVSVDLSGLDTSSATSMYRMFLDCESLDIINVTGFDTSHVKDMYGMFSGCKKLIMVDVSGFSAAASPDMRNMFHYCNSLATLGINRDILAGTADQLAGMATWTNAADNTVYANAAALKAITGKVYLQNARNLKAGDGWYLDSDGCLHIFGAVHNPADEESGTAPWDGCKDEIRSVVTTTGASIDNGIKLFFRCRNLISADLSHLDTSEVESFDRMFCSCAKLTTVDLSGFDTSNVTNMHSMIAGCGSLTSVDLSGFDTSNVTDFSNMFAESGSLTELDLGNFNTANVTTFSAMFYNCSSLEVLDINGFETSKAENANMFLTGCTALSEISMNDSVLRLVSRMTNGLSENGWVNKMTGERYLSQADLDAIVGKVTLVKITAAASGWYLDAAGCLHLAGAVTNNSDDSDATQWKDYKDQIKSVVAYPGSSVTNFNYLFCDCRNLRTVDLSNLAKISDVTLNYTFANCRNLSSVDISCIGSLWRSTASTFHYTSTLREITATKNVVRFMADELTDFSRSWLDANTGDVYESADLRALSGFDAVTLTRFVKIKGDGWYLDKAGGLHITASILNDTEPGGRDSTPWTSYKKEITSVVVENNPRGIYIRNTAGNDNYRGLFSGCVNLTSVDLSKLRISDAASADAGNMILNCTNLTEFTADGALIAIAADELLALSPVWYQKESGTSYRTAGALQGLTGTVTLTSNPVAEMGDGWYLDNDGCLHIIGKVTTIFNPADGVHTPWEIDREQIRTVVTESGASIDNCENMFKDCVNLTSADLSHLDTSEVVSMSWMFSGCRNLNHVDVSGFNTENVERMYDMFNNCRALTELDLNSFRAIDDAVFMDGMFGGCGRLYSLKIGNFSPLIAYTEYTFFGCISLSEIEINDKILIGFSQYDLSTADQLISIFPVWVGADGTVYTDANEMKSKRGAVVLTRGVLPEEPDEPEDPSVQTLLGDVNCDGSVDSKDVLLLKRAAAGLITLESAQKINADVNHDENIDSKDVLMLKRAAAGLVALK